MRRQPSRRALFHLIALLGLAINLLSPLAPPPHALAAESTRPSAPVAPLLAPAAPDPLAQPFVDPASAARAAALGSAADALPQAEAPARLEPLPLPAPQAPAVSRPAPPDPLAPLNAKAPQSSGLDALASQRASLEPTETVTPTLSPTPAAADSVDAAPATGSAPTETPVAETQAMTRIYLPLVISNSAPAGAPPAATTGTPQPAVVPSATATAAPAQAAATPTATSATANPDTIQVAPDHAATLRSADGRLELAIPAGAVSAPVTIRYRALADQAAPGFRSNG